MFTSSAAFLPFEYFRVPYDVDPAAADDLPGLPGPWGRLAPSDAGRPCLRWPLFDTDALFGPPAPPGAPAAPPPAVPAPPGEVSGPLRFRLGDSVLHGRLVSDEALATALSGSPGTWTPEEPLRDDAGGHVGSVWRSSDGSILLPFDPAEVVGLFWSERYGTVGRPANRLRAAVMAAYYAVRPALPRRLQIAARRVYSRVQARTAFPRWPVEDSLHDLYDRLLAWVAELADRPVPWVAPWPEGRTWALALTHDVETDEGVRAIGGLREVEEELGYRSSWNLVPGRYRVDDALVAELQAAGFEVGLHGLYHDGRDLEPGQLERRLPEMRRYAERWGAVGFRSPATHRAWDTMAGLPFAYDSSSPDTDPYEPQNGGCCSLLPFANRGLVELPITLPQDHTLFVILRARDGRAWIEKVEHIRARGGLGLIITHPDYLHLGPIVPAYRQLLEHVAEDPGVWRALPAEVAAWWRRRAASVLEPDGTGWRVAGPAAGEAAVRWTVPPGRPPMQPVAGGTPLDAA